MKDRHISVEEDLWVVRQVVVTQPDSVSGRRYEDCLFSGFFGLELKGKNILAAGGHLDSGNRKIPANKQMFSTCSQTFIPTDSRADKREM